MSCENVEAVPCAYVSGAAVITDPAVLASTCAISCRGVPGSTAIHMPVVKNVPPAAVVSVVPPSAVVAVITVPRGETCSNPDTAQIVPATFGNRIFPFTGNVIPVGAPPDTADPPRYTGQAHC